MIGRTLVSLIAAAGIIATAYAQGAPQGGHRRGGPEAPGQHGRPGVPVLRPIFLMHPDLQRELKLSPDQISKIQELMPKPGERPGAPGGQQRGGNEGGFRRPGEGPGRGGMNVDAKVREILNDAQESRYEQILLQHFGATSIFRPDISEKLNITEDQKLRMHETMQAIRSQAEKSQGGRPSPEEMQRHHEQLKAEIERRLMAILTTSQKEQWQSMLGKPFKLEMPPHRPGGRNGN